MPGQRGLKCIFELDTAVVCTSLWTTTDLKRCSSQSCKRIASHGQEYANMLGSSARRQRSLFQGVLGPDAVVQRSAGSQAASRRFDVILSGRLIRTVLPRRLVPIVVAMSMQDSGSTHLESARLQCVLEQVGPQAALAADDIVWRRRRIPTQRSVHLWSA